MKLSYKPYSGLPDLKRMRELVAKARARVGHASSRWHVGDVNWRLYQNLQCEPEKQVQLIQDEWGHLLGFVHFTPPNTVDWCLLPGLNAAADADLRVQALTWALMAAAKIEPDIDKRAPMQLDTLADDAAEIAFLKSSSYELADPVMHLLQRDLRNPISSIESIEASALPEGITVRHPEEHELAERVDVHREVWSPSRFTLEGYQRLRRTEGYDPELDLVAATPSGQFLSYCICWYDAQNKVGEFEPVGTRPAHQRNGLGKAVLQEGFRRLQARGAEAAVVYSYPKTLPFYLAAGFVEVNRWIGWTRPVLHWKPGEMEASIKKMLANMGIHLTDEELNTYIEKQKKEKGEKS